ncbi:hypothetical protein IJ541_04805 [bacterium]|nr:hypothetical protein [bacterium]
MPLREGCPKDRRGADWIASSDLRPPRNDNTVIASTNDSGFADGRSKASPDSEKIEQTATKWQLRNFSSFEQIQASECVAIQLFLSFRTCFGICF